MAPESRTDRTSPDHAVGGEVAGAERPSLRADRRDDLPGQIAAIQAARAFRGNLLQCLREVGKADDVAGEQTRAVRPAVQPPAFGGVAQDQVEDCVQMGLSAIQLDPVTRQLERRLDHLAPGQPSVGAVHGLEPGARPWHRT